MTTTQLTTTTVKTDTPLLAINGLTVRFRLCDATVHAVTDLYLTVRPGELLAVVGESGCGKSVLAHALLGLLPANATVTGRALLHQAGDAPVDLVACGERYLASRVRGRRIGLVPQSPTTALNPVRTGRRLLPRSASNPPNWAVTRTNSPVAWRNVWSPRSPWPRIHRC